MMNSSKDFQMSLLLSFGGHVPPPNAMLSYMTETRFNVPSATSLHNGDRMKQCIGAPLKRRLQLDANCKSPPKIRRRLNTTARFPCGNNGSLGPGKQPVTQCHQCKKTFTLLSDLNEHFVQQHSNVLQQEFDNSRYWKCNVGMDVSNTLSEPPSKTSNQVSTPGYQCPNCKYFAKWPTELQKHMMVHSKERPHQCVICGLTYKWKWDLGRHFDKSHQNAHNPYKKNPMTSSKLVRRESSSLTEGKHKRCKELHLEHQSDKPQAKAEENKAMLRMFVRNYMSFIQNNLIRGNN